MKRVKNSSQGFTREEYESYSAKFQEPFKDKLPAADLLYGVKTKTAPEPEPETAETAATGGAPVFVKVTPLDGRYEAKIVPNQR